MQKFKVGINTPLDVRALPGGKMWEMLSDYIYLAPKELGGDLIVVWEGAQHDFASIPPIAWRLIGPPATGKYRDAAPVHDILYRAHYKDNRKLCDQIFLDIMKRSGVKRWRRNLMYSIVRLFGAIPYKRNAVGLIKEYRKCLEEGKQRYGFDAKGDSFYITP